MAINWFLFKRLTRALWFLPALFSIFAVLMVGASFFSTYFFPDGLDADQLPITVSADAVLSILTIIASSMLAVTVFSLSTLVNLLSTASTSTSPRAVSLIVEDRTAQTSISVFIGAFLFSVVAIIGLSGEIYSISGRLILFIATLFVVLAVVWALIRWIGHISIVGRVGDTIDRVETATGQALSRVGPGGLFGCRQDSLPRPADCFVRAGVIGFVQHFDRDALQKLAETNDLTVHVLARPGAYVDFDKPLAVIGGQAAEGCLAELREAFVLGHERTFEYDPGFGLTVLAEIAQRALSPAVNDPGTAIQVLTTQTRLLGRWATDRPGEDEGSTCDRVSIEPLVPAELLAQSFPALARDAGLSIDVTLAVLRGLRSLAEAAPAVFGTSAFELSRDIAARAEASMCFPADINAVRAAAQARLKADGA